MTTRATYGPALARVALERSVATQPAAYIDPVRWVEVGPGEPHCAKGTVVAVERYGDQWRLVVDVNDARTYWVRPAQWRTE